MKCLKTFLNASYPAGAYWKLKVFPPYYRSVRKLRKLQPNLEVAVLIISFGRSGSTWLQECIAKLDDFLTVFEPLSVEFGNSIKDRRDVATQKNKWIEALDKNSLEEYKSILQLYNHPYYP